MMSQEADVRLLQVAVLALALMVLAAHGCITRP
jgi:hypothetical protein